MELAQRLKEIRTRKPTIGSDEGEQIASHSHLKRKRTSNDATGLVPQPSKNLHVDGRVSKVIKVKIKAEENVNPEGSCLGKKSSMWDQEFDFSTHNRSHNLLEGDVPKFESWGVDQLCGGAEKYLSKTVALMCLANLKAKENANAESKREKQLHELQQEVDNLQADLSKREKQLRDLQQKADQLQADAAEVNRLRYEAAKLSKEKSIFCHNFLKERRENKLKADELYELREKKAEFTKSIQDLNVKEAKWKETEESLKNQIAISFGSGYHAALEQVAVLHPTIDLSQMDGKDLWTIDLSQIRSLLGDGGW